MIEFVLIQRYCNVMLNDFMLYNEEDFVSLAKKENK